MSNSSLANRGREGLSVNGDGPVPSVAEQNGTEAHLNNVLTVDKLSVSVDVGLGDFSDKRKSGSVMESCKLPSGLSETRKKVDGEGQVLSQCISEANTATTCSLDDVLLSASMQPAVPSFQRNIAAVDTAPESSSVSLPSTTAQALRHARAGDVADGQERQKHISEPVHTAKAFEINGSRGVSVPNLAQQEKSETAVVALEGKKANSQIWIPVSAASLCVDSPILPQNSVTVKPVTGAHQSSTHIETFLRKAERPKAVLAVEAMTGGQTKANHQSLSMYQPLRQEGIDTVRTKQIHIASPADSSGTEAGGAIVGASATKTEQKKQHMIVVPSESQKPPRDLPKFTKPTTSTTASIPKEVQTSCYVSMQELAKNEEPETGVMSRVAESRQPGESKPDRVVTKMLSSDTKLSVDKSTAMVSIARLAEQTKPQTNANNVTTDFRKTPLDTKGNKYASLFAPKAGQWDSWQRHVQATAANQQNALVAAANQQAAMIASAKLATQQAQQQSIEAAAKETKQHAVVAAAKHQQEMLAQNVAKQQGVLAKEASTAGVAKQQFTLEMAREQKVSLADHGNRMQQPASSTDAAAAALTTQKAIRSSTPARSGIVESTAQSAITAADKRMQCSVQSQKGRPDTSGLAKVHLLAHEITNMKLAKNQGSPTQPASPLREPSRFESVRFLGSGSGQTKDPRQQLEDRRDSSPHSAKRRKSSMSEAAVAPRAVPAFPPPAGAAKPPPKHTEQFAFSTDAFHRHQPRFHPRAQFAGRSTVLPQKSAPEPKPRNADKPMTYLVRQLLGQIPVDLNDPAFVLSPHLVKNASSKIQLVVEKLIEAAVKRTKEKGKMGVLGAASSHIQEMQRELRVLTQHAQERANQVVEQDKIIAELHGKLDENLIVIRQKRKQLEELRLRAPPSGESTLAAAVLSFGDDAIHDETVRTLVQKLHRVIATVQKVKKDIEAYRVVAEQDQIELQQKEGVINLLRAMIDTECAVGKQRAAAAASRSSVPKSQRRIAVLKKEIDNLKDALQQQRATSERRMKAFMGAGSQAFKKQSASTNSRKRKSQNA